MLAGTFGISSVAICFLTLMLFDYTVRAALKLLRRGKQARGSGCESGKYLKQGDPYFGILFLYQNIQDFRARVFLEAWQRRLETSGSTVSAWLLGSKILITSDPENIKAILTTSFDDFERGPHMRAAFARLADGIFAADGDHWKSSRDLLRPSFAKNEVNDTKRFETHFQNLFKVLPTDGTPVDLQPMFNRLTMDTATDLLFGTSTTSLTLETNEKAELFHRAAKVSLTAHFRDTGLGLLGRMLPDRAYFEARQHIRNTVDGYVRHALETNKKQAMGEEPAVDTEIPKRYVFLNHVAERAKDPEVLRDQSVSMLLGGTETTAALLGNLMYVLARRPEIWKKLRVEALSVDQTTLSEGNMKDAIYLSYCLNETLRLYPVLPTTARCAVRDTVLPRGGGADEERPLMVPRGASIYLAFYPMHRRKDIFGEDANEFRPERWATIHPGWGFTPFGGGPRICIGQRFARAEAAYTMLRILQSYTSLTPADDKPWTENISITASSASGCKVYLQSSERKEAETYDEREDIGATVSI